MFTGFLKLLLYLLLPALANIAGPREHSLKTITDIEDFMQSYYQHPRPELIEDLIEALPSSGYLKKLNNAAGVIGFFSEVFATNPARISQWQALIAKQEEQTKAPLGAALSMSKAGGVLNLEGHSAELNDEYWGAFFASGNPKFIARLVDQLRYFDERNDEPLFFAGGTAKWSLASNAQTQSRVRSAIEQAKLKADNRTQELIADLLAKDPESIKQEMIEIIRVQKESGKWR